MGIFSGRRPSNLGVKDGRLAPPNPNPNNVHSQVPATDSHYIAPIKPSRDPAGAFAKLGDLVREMPRASVVTAESRYLYFETSSPTMGFVDDNELLLDGAAGVIHMRAAARLGIRDFDANRKRMESLRARLVAAGY